MVMASLDTQNYILIIWMELNIIYKSNIFMEFNFERHTLFEFLIEIGVDFVSR